MVGIQKVPRTRSIQVYGIGKLTSDHLTLYFENIDGVDVADVKPHADDDCAVVHLTDSTGKNTFVYIYKILLPAIELFVVTLSSHLNTHLFHFGFASIHSMSAPRFHL